MLLVGNSVRGRALPPAAALYYSAGPRPDLRPRGRAMHALGRIRPPYPCGVPPVRYPREADRYFVTPQAVRSGVVTAWLQPQLLDFDAGAGTGLPASPPCRIRPIAYSPSGKCYPADGFGRPVKE